MYHEDLETEFVEELAQFEVVFQTCRWRNYQMLWWSQFFFAQASVAWICHGLTKKTTVSGYY